MVNSDYYNSCETRQSAKSSTAPREFARSANSSLEEFSTHFTATPLAAAPSEDAESDLSNGSGSYLDTADRRQKTVLVVDDQPMVSELLAVLLHPRGFEVCTAASGPEALWIQAHRSFDLLFTDVCMPGMNGVALAAESRKLSPTTKVIFMSGYSIKDLAAMGVNMFGSLLLHKPFTLRSIDTALKAVAEFDQVVV